MNELDPRDDRQGKQPVVNVRGRPELEFPGRRSFIVILVAAGTAFVGALLAVPLVMFATTRCSEGPVARIGRIPVQSAISLTLRNQRSQ